MLHKNIFRSYDIRGLYPNELNEETMKLIGKAYTSYLIRKQGKQSPVIVVGRDNRIHGESLQEAFIHGALEHGARVKKIEDCSSPMLYHSVCKNEFDGGVNITASHNPADYNGCKLIGKMAHSIAGDEIRTILQMILDEDFEEIREGTEESFKIEEAYFQKICSIISLRKKLRVVIDAGNGIAGKYYPELFRRLGCEVIELYCEQDGRFPNHQPDPVEEETTEDLKKRVIKHHADIGIAFDGDGDRFAIIDEKGVYHDANETIVLFIRDILQRHQGSSIVYTVANSLIIPEEIQSLGGKGIMVPVGHSSVEQAMSDTKALFGGEQSGHFFFSENYYGFDDAAYAAAKILEIMTRSEEKVSEHYDTISKTISSPEFRIDCPDEKKFSIIQEISDDLASSYPLNTLDGLRLELGDKSWLGMRASNTAPKISVIVESKTKEHFNTLKKIAEEALGKHDLRLGH